MAVLYTNNASSKLSASITNTATSFSVTAGTGSLFPSISGSDYFYVTLMDSAGNLEIVKVTARSTDTFTVVRGQDGTTARAFSVNDIVELRITKAMLDSIKAELLAAGTPSANTTPPSSPTGGQLWWDSNTGLLKIYYVDANSSQWVDAFPYGATSSVGSVGFSNTYVLTGTTTDGVETEIFVDGVANSRIPLTPNKTLSFVIEIAGRRTDGTTMDSVVISQRCAARNNAGVSSDLGNIAETIVFRSDVAFNADARTGVATNSMNIYVQGAAGKTISWRAVVQTVEV